jgi:hypothetical protein
MRTGALKMRKGRWSRDYNELVEQGMNVRFDGYCRH